MSSDDSTKHHALEAILSRAGLDPDFRRELLRDPRVAVQRAFGITMPADYRVRFLERPADLDALIVLPDVRASSDELSESELESVSGGGDEPSATWAPPPPPTRES